MKIWVFRETQSLNLDPLNRHWLLVFHHACGSSQVYLLGLSIRKTAYSNWNTCALL